MRTSRFWTPKPSQWPVISSRSIKFQVLSLWEWLFEVELTNCQESGSELFQAETWYRVCLYNSFSWPLSLCQAGCFVKSIKNLNAFAKPFLARLKPPMLVFYREMVLHLTFDMVDVFENLPWKTFGAPIFLSKTLSCVSEIFDYWVVMKVMGLFDSLATTLYGWIMNEWCVCTVHCAVQSSAESKDEMRNIAKGTIDPMVECSWQSYYLLI